MSDIRLVDETSQLAAALDHIDDGVVGVDVERADSHRYYRRAALIQIGDRDACVLIDPLALDDLSGLGSWLRSRTSVLHAIENDIVPLHAAGVQPGDVADTAVAAAVLGLPTGLEPLLEEILGVELAMDKDRYQRADWEARPLDDGMMRYAAGDVFHLPELWREMATRLEAAGRVTWYEQELEHTIASAHEDSRDWRRTKGAGRLDPAQRAVLRALWEEREEIAREHDIAPNRLIHDRTLLSLAEEPADDERAIVSRNRRRSSPLPEHADRILAALRRGLEAEPEDKESNGRRWRDSDRTAYDQMRRRRAEIADGLGIDPGVLCPGRPLWGAIVSDPQSPEELAAEAGLRPWQAEILADELWAVHVEARADD
jgi:ribonuclease D